MKIPRVWRANHEPAQLSILFYPDPQVSPDRFLRQLVDAVGADVAVVRRQLALDEFVAYSERQGRLVDVHNPDVAARALLGTVTWCREPLLVVELKEPTDFTYVKLLRHPFIVYLGWKTPGEQKELPHMAYLPAAPFALIPSENATLPWADTFKAALLTYHA